MTQTPTHEPRESRIKRLHMRAWRRGIKEMDLVLGAYADGHLAGMDDVRLAAFDALLHENDQDLLAWITGQAPMPAQHAGLLAEIMASRQN